MEPAGSRRRLMAGSRFRELAPSPARTKRGRTHRMDPRLKQDFLAITNFGGLAHGRVLRSMELMARHVLPAFHS